MLCRPARLFLETRTHGSERITGPCVHLLRKEDLIMQHQIMFSQKIFVYHLFYNKYVIYSLPIINIIIIEGSKLNVGDWLKSL